MQRSPLHGLDFGKTRSFRGVNDSELVHLDGPTQLAGLLVWQPGTAVVAEIELLNHLSFSATENSETNEEPVPHVLYLFDY
jgi:hypothetical protein